MTPTPRQRRPLRRRHPAPHRSGPTSGATSTPIPGGARARSWTAIVVAIVLVAVVAGCGVDAGKMASPRVSTRSDDGHIVGSDVEATTTTQATTTTLPTVDLDVSGDDGSKLNRVIANAIEDLDEYWTDEYPDIYGSAYEPLSGGLFAIDASTDPRAIPCAGDDIRELLDNAFYCPTSDAVVWDQEGFMPDVAERYGDFTAAVVIAHEWGHVVQGRSGFEGPSVIVELQADCFAGAWTDHVMDGDDARFHIGTDDLDRALAGILSLRDAPGGSADDPLAHGSGFDRVGAFQDGYEDGAERCSEFTNGDPAPFQWPFSGEEEARTGGDLPLTAPGDDDDILDLTFPVLADFWTDTYPTLSDGDDWDPLGDPVPFEAGDEPTCGGDRVTGYVLFVCIPDRYVGFEVGTTFPELYDQNGDFGVATLLATQYGLDAVEQLGSARDDVSATLQGDCFAGAFAEALLPDEKGQSKYRLVLSPGDLDEGVSALLSFRSAGARARQGPGFDQVKAFRKGVLEGAAACPDLKAG